MGKAPLLFGTNINVRATSIATPWICFLQQYMSRIYGSARANEVNYSSCKLATNMCRRELSNVDRHDSQKQERQTYISFIKDLKLRFNFVLRPFLTGLRVMDWNGIVHSIVLQE